MEHFVVQYMQEDEWMKYIYALLILPRFKIVKIIVYFIIIADCTTLLIETYQMLKTFTAAYFFQYAPFYFLVACMNVTTMIYLPSYNTYVPYIKIFKENFFSNLNNVTERTKQIINRECKYAQIMFITELLLGTIFTIANLTSWSLDRAKYLATSEYVISYFPAWSPYIHGIVSFFVAFSLLPLVTSKWYLLYFLTYMKLQIYILIDSLRRIERDLRPNNNNFALLRDLPHQQKIYNFLKFVIRRHQEILRSKNLIRSLGEYINLLFVLYSVFFSLFTIFAVYSDTFNWTISTIAIVTFFIVMVANTEIIQLYEDSSLELAAAVYKLQWYSWDIKNMKMFLIFHQYTSTRIVESPIPSFLPCNRTLLKEVLKLMYSVANILHSMRN